MTLESLLIFLVVGAIAGWLAGRLVRGFGYGGVGNIVIGVIGSFVGGLLFSHFDLARGSGLLLENLIGAILGAVILLLLVRLFRRRTVVDRLLGRRF